MSVVNACTCGAGDACHLCDVDLTRVEPGPNQTWQVLWPSPLRLSDEDVERIADAIARRLEKR